MIIEIYKNQNSRRETVGQILKMGGATAINSIREIQEIAGLSVFQHTQHGKMHSVIT